MANGIGRKRSMGIAMEATYGTYAATPIFTLPLLDTPRIDIKVNKERNVAALGSSYGADDVKTKNRMVEFSLNVKIDEDHVPMLLAQKFSISSVTASGETTVYNHTLTYSSSNDLASYTLFLDDDDRTSIKTSGCRFSKINIIAEQGFLRAEIDGMGSFPTNWSGSTTIVEPNEFVGRNVVYSFGTYGSTSTATSALTATLNHEFGLSAEETNFVLGSQEISKIYNTEDIFTSEIEGNFSAFATFRDKYTANTAVQWDLNIIDTGRTVTGSSNNTTPKIKFDYKKGYIEDWSEDGGLSDILKEKVTLLAVDDPTIAAAPLEVTVTNSKAGSVYTGS
jgi:hypothetical protein